jgi:hypothetical protein
MMASLIWDTALAQACAQLLHTLTAAAADLPQHLPGFMWQSVQLIAASGQPLISRPLVSTVVLLKHTVQLLISDDYTNAHSIRGINKNLSTYSSLSANLNA